MKRLKIKTLHLLFHLMETGSEGGETGFIERKCNLSLDFPAFGPSVLVEQRGKVDLRCRDTCGHRFCEVSTTPRGRGFLLLALILI